MKISQNKVVSLLVVLVLLLGLSPVVVMANAPAFSYGDVFASVSNGQAYHYSSAGVYLETLDDGLGGYTTGSAFDAAGNFYMTNFSNTKVTKFDRNFPHNILQVIDTAAQSPGGHSESIFFDLSGNFYVGHASGNRDIHKYDAAGSFIEKYDVPINPLGRGSDWIVLAADQKTMFYTSLYRGIRRYDVSAKTSLADFATLSGPGVAYAFRLLPDGGLIVADEWNIKRLNPDGTVNMTYDAPGQDCWFALNRDPDGTSFWSGDYCTGNITKFDIATGAVLMTIDTGVGSDALFGLSVFGEKTEGGPQPEPEPVEVGGTIYPVNKLAMLAPWISLVAVLILGTILAVNRRRVRS